MSDETLKTSKRVLDPIDRVSEILFGLIMVLTSTNTLSVATAGRAEIGTMIMGALGCNLAWGIIDAALYVMGCLNERGRNLLMLRAAGICVLVFVSTFPVVIPFLFFSEVRPALRLSNAVAIVMMFFCGYVFAQCTGLRPWPTGLLMVAIGCAMVGVAIALGG